MKLNAWQMVAVLATLFAAIIGANVFAPGTSAVVVSMATTAFGALFLSRDGRGPPTPRPPNVPLVCVGILACIALSLPTACGNSVLTSNPSDDAKLAACRGAARRARDGGASPLEAYESYEECKYEAGLP